MFLHLTEKLCDKLRLPPLPPALPAMDARMDWYANLFTVERVQYVLTTHAPSLYSVLTYGRGITDDDLYLRTLFPLLREHLEADDLAYIYDRNIAPNLGSVDLSKTRDRSVLGSMNDMAKACKYMITHRDADPWQLTDQINTTPFKAIGFKLPREQIVDVFERR